MAKPRGSISFIPIQPERMNEDAIRQQMLNALRREGTVHKKQLRKTVDNWVNKPKFESKISLPRVEGKDVKVETFPTGSSFAVENWGRIDQGTVGPYPITAKNAPFLMFLEGYNPKTRPGQFRTFSSKSFGALQKRSSVMHPGIRARNWTKVLSKVRKVPFRIDMERSIAKGASKLY